MSGWRIWFGSMSLILLGLAVGNAIKGHYFIACFDALICFLDFAFFVQEPRRRVTR